MTPADGDGLVTSNEALADLALDDATRADFEACWEVLCAAPPAELAERHIRAAAALAAKSAAQQPRFTASGRSLAKAAVISAAAFVGTTGLAAADVLPPAAAHMVQTVADTVRSAVDPMPPELSVPAPAPTAPAVAAESVADAPVATTTPASIDTTTTIADAPTTSLLGSTTTTVTTLVDKATTTTTVPDDGTATAAGAGSTTTTTTTTVPDDGTATAAGTGSTTTSTTQPSSSTTSTTTPSSSTTTTTPPPTTTP